MKIAILIIAAGESKRLGQAKQLVKYNGTELINNTIRECKNSAVGDLFLVLGANRKIIEKSLNDFHGTTLYNEDWKKGMGNSISFGVKSILKKEYYDGIIITVADQPHLKGKIFKSLMKKQEETQADIILCKYEKGNGPPSFFSEKYLPELIKLSGNEGAKIIIKKYWKEIAKVDFLLGNIDIDTPEDLKNMNNDFELKPRGF